MAFEVTVAALFALAVVSAFVARELSHRHEIARIKADLVRANATLSRRSGYASVGEAVSELAQELKTPLQEVLGNTELMLATAATTSGNPRQQVEELQQIREGVERAADIVRSLVAFTETGSLSCRWHDVNDIVVRAVAAAQHDPQAARIRIEQRTADRMPMVYVDGRQLEKVLAGLITRPAANGSEARPVTVSVNVARVTTPEDHVVFSIADNGPAFDADDADGASLAAARRVIEAHGGRLNVLPRSTASGARITVEIPIAASATSVRIA